MKSTCELKPHLQQQVLFILIKGGVCMANKIALKFYVNLGRNKEENCFCNYFNPQCHRYGKGECMVKTKLHDPYEGIEECCRNESRTYEKRHGRIVSKRT